MRNFEWKSGQFNRNILCKKPLGIIWIQTLNCNILRNDLIESWWNFRLNLEKSAAKIKIEEILKNP